MNKEETQQKRLNERLKPLVTATTDDSSEFDSGCEFFRTICNQIKTATGLAEFKGGYDDIIAMYQSVMSLDVATEEGKQKLLHILRLLIALLVGDSLCNYQGVDKLKLGRPNWWYQCWSQESSK